MYIVQERTTGSTGRFTKVKDECMVVTKINRRQFSFFPEVYTVEDMQQYFYRRYLKCRKTGNHIVKVGTQGTDKRQGNYMVTVVTLETDKRQEIIH
jgi:hypothetical protein